MQSQAPQLNVRTQKKNLRLFQWNVSRPVSYLYVAQPSKRKTMLRPSLHTLVFPATAWYLRSSCILPYQTRQGSWLAIAKGFDGGF